MKKVTIHTPLGDFKEDWGGTYHNGAQQPFPDEIILADGQEWGHTRGEVERVIKEMASGKAGEFYYDNETSRYLIFADADDRELFLTDREQYASLLIGSFDAPANYYAEINMESPAANVVMSGSTGNYIDFTFDIKNKTGASTGEGVIATYTFNNAGNQRTVTQIYNGGVAVHFLADEYLTDGTNRISIVVTGRNTAVSTTASVLYTVVKLELESNFDFSASVLKGNEMLVPYTISGAGVKYIEWYIDGVLQSNVDNVTDIKADRTKTISTTNLAVGKHSIQTRAYITNNGTNYYSKTLYFNFYVRQSGTATAVLLGVELDEPTLNGTIVVNAMQYEAIPYKLAVYDSRSRTLPVTLTDNNTIVQTITMQPNTVDALSYSPATSGTHTLVFTADSQTATITATVGESSVGIEEVTDGLTLKLSAKNRSNTEAHPNTWTYTSGGTTITTQFNGFAWNEQSGWNNGALVIPVGASIDINYEPMSGRLTQYGRTIEIDYEASNIENDDAQVINLVNGSTGAGLAVTASTARLRSSGGAEVNTKYRSGDRVHLTFIVNRTDGDNDKLMYIVNNGVLERAAAFAQTDSFTVSGNLHIGSTGCTVKIHSIRVYGRALSVEEAFCNYAVDSDNIVAVANRNNILDETTGAIDVDKVNAQVPVIIITGDMQPIFDTTDKNTTVYVDMEYRNMQDPTKNFTATHVRMRPQGTSSLGYPRKNLRPYTSSQYGCTMYDANGNIIENGLYAFKDKSQPVNCWTLKADYAESSGSHNTGVARIWNDLMYNAQIDGNFVLRTEAQKAALQNGYDYDVRTTVDGFPIVVFWRETESSELISLGQYNFNNDKSTEAVFGFRDIPGFDNTNVQCFEFLANENPICLFDDVSNFDTAWDDAFESRYPDTKTPNLAPLKRLAVWINSCKNNQNRWNTEKSQYFDLNKLAAYYVYLMRFGAVDQAVKNAMITTEDGVHWFFINYDNDTILGIDNISTVLNAWDYDRQSITPNATYYYAGHSSVLWNCFEADPECMALVPTIDVALYSAGLTYENMIRMFDEEQCGKWCERIYNDNGRYKYIQPYREKGSAVLYMLQGSRTSYRHWWLQHRFDAYDAKWSSGAFRARVIRFIAEGAQGGTFVVTSATNTYYGYGINNVPYSIGTYIAKDESHSFHIAQTLAIGDPVSIYNANNAKAVDLSDFATNMTTLYINQAVGNDGLSELKVLKLGNGTSINNKFTDIGGLDAITSLEEIDIRGFLKITNLSLSRLSNLHVFKASGSGLTSFAPAAGATLTDVSLPATLQSIVLDNTRVTSLTYTATHSLRIVTIRNVTGAFNVKNFVLGWIDLLTDEEKQQAELTLTGINWTGCTAQDAIKLGSIYTENLQGKLTISESITVDEYNQIVDIYGANVFEPSGTFVIDAPSAFMLSGPTSLSNGDTGQYTATVFPITEANIIYILYNGHGGYVQIQPQTDSQGRVYRTLNGITLYEATGEVTCSNSLASEVLFSVRARIANTASYSDPIDGTARPTTFPSSITITGIRTYTATGDYTYTKSFNTTNYNAQLLSVVWTLNGTSGTTLLSQDNDSATIRYTQFPASTQNITLTCRATFERGRVLTNSINITLLVTPLQSFELSGVARIQDEGTYQFLVSNMLPANYNIGIASLNAFISATTGTITTTVNGVSGVTLNVSEMPESSETIVLTAVATLSNGDELVATKSIRLGEMTGYECVFKGNGDTAVQILCSSTQQLNMNAISAMSIDGYPINPIRSYAFGDTNEHIVSIETTASSTTRLFSQTDIVSCAIGTNISAIGEYCFYGCANLGSVTIADGTTTLGLMCFALCRKLHSFVIPNSVTNIGNDAFYSCSDLTSIGIPNSVTRIGNSAFRGAGIVSLSIPASVISIGTFIIGESPVSSLTVDSANDVYDSRNSCNAIIETETNTIIAGCKNTIIPNSVTSIGSYAFSYCSGLTSITIPNSVTSIDEGAFSNSKELTSIEIPNSITSIGDNVFRGCSGLTSITIPNSVTSIGNYAFNGCIRLTSITIPNSVTSIGGYAFSSCTSLTSIEIPNSVTRIENNVFSVCRNLTSVVIPNSVMSIGNYAFYSCVSLASITIPNSVTSIGYYAFGNCTGLTSITIPDSVTSIGEYAFRNCSGLTSIGISNSVTSIGLMAFYDCSSMRTAIINNTGIISKQCFANCTSLESVEIGNSVNRIGEGVFQDCTSLASVTIPNSVTIIDDFAFRRCSGLTSVTISSSVTSIGWECFYNCTLLSTLSCLPLTAPTITSITFTNIGTQVPSGTPKSLNVPSGATGYDTGYWESQVIDKGYTLNATL